MSSVLSASNPFLPLVQAKTITPELVKEVVASVPKDTGLTEDDVYRDLKGIVSTNAFADKTPALSDEVKARIGSLEPAKQASPINNLANGFALALTEPPAPGAIYANAHQLSAAITGAVVALQAELADTTVEQKADKQSMLEGFQNNIISFKTLQLYSGLWSALAKPTGNGDFALKHSDVEALTASMREGDITPELKAILQAKLAPGGAAEGAEASPADTAKMLEAQKAKREHELSRPVGGKTTEELEAIYRDVAAKAHIGRITYRPESFRTELNQKMLNALNESQDVEYLKPILREHITRINIQKRRAQKANYTEISPENASRVSDKQLVAMKKVADRLAAKMGGGETSITRIASDVLNAWVSSIDMEHPHATYFSHLQDIVWDGVKGDWLKFYVGPDDKECAPDAPGAKEVSGEALCEVVLAHELNHINEQAVLNQFLLSLMLGVNLAATSANSHADSGCLCSGCANIEERVNSLDTMLADPQIKQRVNSPKFAIERQKLTQKLGIDGLVSDAHAAQKELDEDARLPANERTMSDEQRVTARARVNALDQVFLTFTREGEWTADYGAVRVVGPEAPKWMAMAFDIVNRSSGKGSPEERLQQLKEAYFRDQRADNKYNLQYSEEGGAVSHAQVQTTMTHPTRILRAIGNFDYAESPGAKAVWAFENRNVRARLLGAAQAVDSQIERLEDQYTDFEHGTRDHLPPEESMKTLNRTNKDNAVYTEYERMRTITGPIAKLIFDDGLPTGGRSDTPYCIHAAQFMKQGGEPIFRHSGASNPLAALLGDGSGKAPSCVKMASQLADELQKLVDQANLPDAKHKAWMGVVSFYRQIAKEGSDGAARECKERVPSRRAERSLGESLGIRARPLARSGKLELADDSFEDDVNRLGPESHAAFGFG